MILPIVAYGNQVLKQVAKPIDADYPKLNEFIENLWETMYNGRGVGLAAPQVGVGISVFIVDSLQLVKENEEMEEGEEKYKLKYGIKKVFINPIMVEETGDEWIYEEGCLSIPDVRVKIERKEIVQIKYMDENFIEHLDMFDGMNARIIQHEYDHLQGILLTDHMSSLKKSLVKGKLENISRGRIETKYKMKFALTR
ncbi:MAG: peptide deformylase [Chitinophagales bacterium]